MSDHDTVTERGRGRGRVSVALAIAACLSVPARAASSGSESLDLSATAMALPAVATGSRLASLPAEPSLLPEQAGIPVSLRFPLPEPSARSQVQDPIAPVGVTAPPRPSAQITLTDRLLSRMEGEARRRPLDVFFRTEGGGRPDDSALEAERTLHAERIIGRSLARTFDQQLEQVARTTWGMGPVFDWLEDISRRQPGREARLDGARSATGPEAAQSGFAGSFGFRLGAHPRLVMRTRFLGLQGRIDVPLLEDEVRLSLERPVGDHGRATFAGVFPRGETGRVSLTFNFNF